jgi:pteridine reductase
LGDVTHEIWNDLLASNLSGPFFLSQALAPLLKKERGCIINNVDINAQRPLKNHTVYNAAKAGKLILTQSLALELAPEVRVNGIAPGAILWPESTSAAETSLQQTTLEKIPLRRCGTAADIARTLLFLAQDAPYITGQIIAVDGGRSLNQ